jgi:uncharacterized protein (TIGR02569 family)
VSLPPDPGVLARFGLGGGAPTPLAGGQGETWRIGHVALKPIDDEVEAAWVGAVLSDLREDGFRISRPVPTIGGTWTAGGWSASQIVEGAHDLDSRWPDVLAAGRALNVSLRGVERPSFLDRRDHAWAVADRMAWDEQPLTVSHPELRDLADRLSTHVEPTESSSQVIHGDIAGNVLFADGLPPAIIDFTPYWRPALFSLAVVVADAVAWHGAEPKLARHLPDSWEARSMLARAGIYRLVASDRLGAESVYLADDVTAFQRICTLLDRDLL